MLTVIICSRHSDISANLRRNILSTIGCEYELVIIDNSQGNYSIFSAYNEGAKRARGNILCFVHDDLLFKEINWGNKISQILSEDNNIGVVGVAGSHFLPRAPFYWWSSPFISEHNLTCGKECFNWLHPESSLVDAVACDGMCMFFRKTIFEKIRFDEDHFKGFHCYDMDICMQVLQEGYRVCITNEILVDHQWQEQYQNNELEKWLDVFYEKWNQSLPIWKGVECLPNFTLNRLNNLCLQMCDAKKVRRSKAYRLGHHILHPLSFLKH